MKAADVAQARGLRALLFGLVTTVAALLAHWSASGMTASPLVLILGFAGASVVGWSLLPRRRPRSVVLASVGLQVALHAAFAASMATGGMRAVSLVLCQAQHPGGLAVDAPAGFLAPQHGALAMIFGLPGLPMLLTHVGAGALSGTWMYVADRLARRLAAVIAVVMRAVLPAVPAAASPPPRRPVPRPERRAPAYRRDRLTGGCGRRGPPAAAPC